MLPVAAAGLRLFIAFLLFAGFSLQQNAYTTPCRRWLHQTCIVNNRLYTDGGLVYEGTSITGQPAQKNGYLLVEDLTTIPADSAANAGFPVQNATAKSANVPIVVGGTLWADDTNRLFYLYGGSYYDTSPSSFQLWLYDAIYNTWNTTTLSQGQDTIVPTHNGAGAVDERGLAYYYGGYANDRTSSTWTGGEQMTGELVVYDMTSNSFTSAPPTTGNVPRAEGVLLYIPASDSGMLVYFGGVTQASNGSETFSPMDQILLYDVKSSSWYAQTASGSVPPTRRSFCAGATWADDYSSYNLYLYGGFDENGNGLNDAWILSLPSFEWIQYYSDSVYPNPTGHGWTTCNVYSRSQMIVMGGFFPNQSHTACDVPVLGNQHGMSLGQQNVAGATWYTFLPNVTTYDVPENITSVVGGQATGGATLRSPFAGWANQDLPVYFTRSYTATRTPTRYVPSSTSSSDTTSAASPSGDGGSNTGAIAGGVVGGVIGLVAILGLALFCLRRRKKSKATSDTSTDQPYPPHTKNSSYISEMPQPSPLVQYHTPHDSPQVPHGSPPQHHQEFSQSSSHPWYHDTPAHQASGTNWNPVPVFHAGPTQAAGPAPMNANQHTYYPPPPRPQHASHGEEQVDGRAELSATRTPVPLDGMMLHKSDQRDWGR